MMEALSVLVGIVVGSFALVGGLWKAGRFILAILPKSPVYASLRLTSEPSIGNTLTLSNPTDATVLVDHWELVWSKWHWFRRVDGQVEGDQPFDSEGFPIPAKGRHTFVFADADYFVSGQQRDGKGKLFLRVYMNGNPKPQRIMVYDPSQ